MNNLPDSESDGVTTVDITGIDDSDLRGLSDTMGLSLSTDEMLMLKHYFRDLGRNPTDVELQAMAQAWSEHCCYKSSRFYLKKYFSGLNTPETILAMEDDAGIVSFDDEHAYVVKMESHNHPSAVEPYGGAATGVGGILRDVLCMGAQPLALLDSLYFGSLGDKEKSDSGLSNRFIVNGVVSGIRDYGNRVGIPTVSGSVDFDSSYDGMPLVNVGCIGIVRKDKISRSRITKTGAKLILAGGRTGRDGIHGVTFASRVLSDSDDESQRAVQLGNPIIKEPLIHAVLEANEAGLIEGMKDLGGGGLSSSVGEMCHAGGLSAEVDLERVLLKAEDMEPWEIWVSESQERMLLAVLDSNLEKVDTIFSKWDIEYSVIGQVIDSPNLMIRYRGSDVLDLSLEFLTTGPMYARNFRIKERDLRSYPIPKELKNYGKFLKEFFSDPSNSSRFNIVRQYDHTVRGNTIVKPFAGLPNGETHSDASVIKPLESSFRGLAVTSGSRPSMVAVDPYLGTKATLAEAYRNVLVTGAKPHSLVDSLNFGNPEEPEVMGQLIEASKAVSEFCKYFSIPVVAGNVSLYNQSGGRNIKPTPTVMITGIHDDIRKAITSDLKEEQSLLFVIGSTSGNLSGSSYLNYLGIESESLDDVDYEELYHTSEGFLKASNKSLIRSAHDVSSGGLIQTLLEMSFGRSIGFNVDISDISDNRTGNKLFSEDGNRIVVEVRKTDKDEFLDCFSDVQLSEIGTTGGSRVVVKDLEMTYVDEELTALRVPWETGLDRYI